MLQIQNPYQQFFDTDGKPLDDGAIYIGVAGLNPQTNQIVVFWDEALTLPAAQPIKTINGFISSSGNAGILYANDINYSMSVYSKNGELVLSTLDATSQPSLNGSAVSVPSISALKAMDKTANQSAFVQGYYAQGDGGGGNYWMDAADTTSADNGGTIIVATDGGRWKLIVSDVFSAAVFGALGDGVADDGPALQSAINALPADGSVALLIPAGVYVSAQKLTSAGKTLTIYGEGMSATQVVFSTPGNGGFSFTLNPSPALNSVQISNMSILADGVHSDAGLLCDWGTPVANAERALTINNLVVGAKTFGLSKFSVAIDVNACFNGEIMSPWIIGDSGRTMAAIKFRGGTVNVQVIKPDISFASVAVEVTTNTPSSEGITVQNGVIYNVINGCSFGTGVDFRVDYCHIDVTQPSSAYAVEFTESAQSGVVGGTFYLGGTGATKVGVDLSFSNSVKVRGLKIVSLSGTTAGINSFNSLDCQLVDNFISSATTGISLSAGDSNFLVMGNQTQNCTDDIIDAGVNYKIGNVISGGNSITTSAALAGSPPSISCDGPDSVIDLKLQPKGSGLVQFGYLIPSASSPAGFSAQRILYIKDSSGTEYYVPVMDTAW